MKSIAWDIWLYCNYNCNFCNSKTATFPKEMKTSEELIVVWDKVYRKYGRCKIYITGGEPFLYPDFVSIVLRLSKFHDLHITTNLSFDINKLISLNINKDFIFINATYHPFYQNIYEFINKVDILKKNNYKISVTYMSDDFQMTELMNYKNIFFKNNIDFSLVDVNCKKTSNNIVKSFLINGCISEKENSVKINERSLCNAGYSYQVINSNGDIFVCSRNKNKIGNIFVNGLTFFKKRIKCNKDCILLEKKYY